MPKEGENIFWVDEGRFIKTQTSQKHILHLGKSNNWHMDNSQNTVEKNKSYKNSRNLYSICHSETLSQIKQKRDIV